MYTASWKGSISTISVKFWASHQFENSRTAWRYARRGLEFRISPAKYSMNRFAAGLVGAYSAGPLPRIGLVLAPGAGVLRRRFRGGSSNPVVYVLGFESHRDDCIWIAIPAWKPLKKLGGREGFTPLRN
jgi:hypothetical protein